MGRRQAQAVPSGQKSLHAFFPALPRQGQQEWAAQSDPRGCGAELGSAEQQQAGGAGAATANNRPACPSVPLLCEASVGHQADSPALYVAGNIDDPQSRPVQQPAADCSPLAQQASAAQQPSAAPPQAAQFLQQDNAWQRGTQALGGLNEPCGPANDGEHQQHQDRQQQHSSTPQPGPAEAQTPACAAPASNAVHTAAPAALDSGLTDYELQRLERIRRNQEVMLSMGLGAPALEPRQPAAPPAKRPARKRPAAAEAAPAVAQPVRRSARTSGSAAGTGAGRDAAQGAAAAAAPEPDPELQYDDSSVLQYICEVLAVQSADSTGGRACSEDADVAAPRIMGFSQLPGCLHDPALARAYSVDWRPGLVAAGGKDGVVSVFGSRELEGGRLAPDAILAPLLSHKLHKGWVSDVQLLPGNSGRSSEGSSGGDSSNRAPLLLTAGNDGAVCLWDLGRAAEAGGRGGALPQCLARACNLHSGGIFSLHEQGERLLTASKDGTVVVSNLDGGTSSASDSMAAVLRYDELHEGVVKCARWREDGACATFASCGNDRRLCIVDTRQPPSTGASLALEGPHATAINCLRWHPGAHHLLLSASHDPALLLHDLRSPAQPLHRLLGHARGPRIASIYQPCFVAGGAAIATGCEKSQLLSLYCTSSGAAISRGATGITPGATFCGKYRTDPLICTASKAIYMFQPAWVPAT